jgi:hypothetical protein
MMLHPLFVPQSVPNLVRSLWLASSAEQGAGTTRLRRMDHQPSVLLRFDSPNRLHYDRPAVIR